jgi:hypothetical protein
MLLNRAGLIYRIQGILNKNYIFPINSTLLIYGQILLHNM